METIHIGNRRQLFIDYCFIESGSGITLVANAPRKAGPVELDAEPGGMITVVQHEGRLCMYYRTDDGCAVAESEDGRTWRTIRGSVFGGRRTIPLPAVGAGSVFVDPKDAAYPFKGIFDVGDADEWGLAPGQAGSATKPTGKTQAASRGGLYLFRSEDGLVWELVPGLPVPFLCDTQNQVLFDPHRDRYAAYLRAFPSLKGSPQAFKRCVARTETADLYQMPWPHNPNPDNKAGPGYDFPYICNELPIVMAADPAEDPPGTDLYNPAVHVYAWADGIYFAFPSLYRSYGYSGENVSHGRDMRGNWSNGGLFETQLFVGRDGRDFTRFHASYIEPGLIRDHLGLDGEPDCGMIMMGIGMARRGDWLDQYCYSTRRVHGAPDEMVERGMNGRAVYRLVQRLDGFVSADADHKGGELVTPPLTFEGARLSLNAQCDGLGEIWVEILDGAGSPVAGYTMDEAVSIDRNGTAQEIWWRQGPDLAPLAGKPVRLRIRMRSAKLYAFEFGTAPAEGSA